MLFSSWGFSWLGPFLPVRSPTVVPVQIEKIGIFRNIFWVSIRDI